MGTPSYIVIKDEYGVHHQYKNGLRALVEPSQLWLDEHPAREPEPDEPAPNDDAITAEEALAILLGGEDE